MPDPLSYGSGAAQQLEFYQPRISANFEIPVHIGRLIAQWDKPEFVAGAEADFMRPDDYVVGLVHQGQAVAFPLWITDYYHVINCRIGGDPLTFATCERCQSGSAFLAVLDGEPLRFSAMGMYNASLTMTDRPPAGTRRGSIWLHYEGVCIHGPLQGRFLPQIPSYHLTWEEWRGLHPESTVMGVPRNDRHQDARLGHGREEYFSRPGMDPPLIQTITGELDGRYPENEMVLGINCDAGLKAWPLKEVQRSGGMVEEAFCGHPILVVAGPRPEQITMAAYSRVLGDKTLQFHRVEEGFVDRETGSLWNIEGLAVEGPFAGKRLEPLRWQYVRWHAWFYPHRKTELYLHSDEIPAGPETGYRFVAGPFERVLNALAATGARVGLEHVIPHLSRPHEADVGWVVRVGTERLNLLHFRSAAAAEDYVRLQGAYFCHPIALRLGRKSMRRFGVYVVESDPERQHEGPSRFVRLPDPEIRWSRLVEDGALPELEDDPAAAEAPADLEMFTGWIRHLKKLGFDVVEAAFLPHSQLRVGAVNGIAATINADRFSIYKFPDEETARRAASELTQALCVGRWVFRSTPAIMFQDPCYEMGELGESQILWSPLVEAQRFHRALKAFWGSLDPTSPEGSTVHPAPIPALKSDLSPKPRL